MVVAVATERDRLAEQRVGEVASFGGEIVEACHMVYYVMRAVTRHAMHVYTGAL